MNKYRPSRPGTKHNGDREMEEEGSFCLDVHHNYIGSAFFKAVQAAKEEKSCNAKFFCTILHSSSHLEALPCGRPALGDDAGVLAAVHPVDGHSPFEPAD